MSGRILVVDEEQSTRELLQSGLARQGFEVVTAASAAAGLELAAASRFDVLLSNVGLGQANGTTLCEQLIRKQPDVPVVVITGVGEVEPAVAAIRAGAYDLICKPIHLESVVLRVQRAVQHRQLREEIRQLRGNVEATAEGSEGVGSERAGPEREGTAHLMTLDQLERRYIRQVIDAAGGNKALAARTLGLDRRTLYRKLERYAAEEHSAED
jgi:DNA-binding NtrC family response regulator